MRCICVRPKPKTAEAKAAPEPEPEPQAEIAVAYKQLSGKCPAAELLTPTDCHAKAAELKLTYGRFRVKSWIKDRWPAGCWFYKNNLYFNTRLTSTRACGRKGSFCICAKKQKTAGISKTL